MAYKLDKSALQTLFEGIRDERRLQANTANRIGNAFLSLLHFCADETSEAYLSRKHDDAAEGVITFLRGLISEQMAQLKAGAQFGDFVSGLYNGKGAQVDANGNAEVESITVRTYMRVMELIVNRLSAQEGDTFFTENDTIESVDSLGDDCYGLHLRSKYSGYFTAQHVGNVIKGVVNNIASAANSGTSADYYTSWMRVNSVNAVKNYIEVTLYPDAEVPAGKNFPPCELMNIARYGNQTDESLQSCFYISSSEGRIVKLTGVTKPLLENYNYGMAFGDMPEFVKSPIFLSSRAGIISMQPASSPRISYRLTIKANRLSIMLTEDHGQRRQTISAQLSIQKLANTRLPMSGILGASGDVRRPVPIPHQGGIIPIGR